MIDTQTDRFNEQDVKRKRERSIKRIRYLKKEGNASAVLHLAVSGVVSAFDLGKKGVEEVLEPETVARANDHLCSPESMSVSREAGKHTSFICFLVFREHGYL